MACVVFQGCKNAAGYGYKWYKGKTRHAHRVAYAVHHNLDIDTMGGVVMHSCDTPSCVNPEHLTLGTHAANMADMVAKNRQATGESQGSSKLTAEQVSEIKRRHKPRCPMNGGSVLAREFGVDPMVVSRIVRGKSWCHTAEAM